MHLASFWSAASTSLLALALQLASVPASACGVYCLLQPTSSGTGVPCGPCIKWGRGYHTIGQSCVVCQTFCRPNGLTESPSSVDGSQTSSPPTGTDASDASSSAGAAGIEGGPVLIDERLFLRADGAIIVAVAAVNPEAAYALHVITVASMAVGPPLPMAGEMFARVLATEASILESIRDGSSDENVQRLTRKIEKAGQLSRTDWKVTKGKDSADLVLTHGLYDTENRKLSALYPDIEVALTWVGARRGGGYWLAESWRVLQ